MNSARDQSPLRFLFRRKYGIGILSLAFSLIGCAGLTVVLFAVSEKVRQERLGLLTVCFFVLVILGFFTGIFGVFEKKHRWCAAAGAIVSGLFLVFVLRPEIDWKVKYGGRQAHSVSNLKAIASACSAYARDNNGLFPDERLEKLYPDYIGDKMVFYLHFHHDEEIVADGPLAEGIDYEYVKGLSTHDLPRNLLAYEKRSWESAQRIVLFVDGRVEVMSEPAFQRRLEETKQYLRKKNAAD